ncbi:MAG: 50S ribosomal protein L21 [Candidatus Moraniibacteriota bacterium]
MFAVIATGGKQYLVKRGDLLKLEKLAGEPGSNISFDSVLLLSKDNEGKEITLGQPSVASAKVEAKIIESGKDKKITVLKYKPKKRYRVKKGHRQWYTKVEITGIEG